MNITVYQARDLALRMLGLYCGLQIFKSIPRFVWLATMDAESPYPGDPTIEMFGEIMVTVVYLLAAYLLLLHTDYVIGRIWRGDETNSETQALPPIATVDFWVRLIGVYFLIWSLANVASVIWFWFPGFRYDTEFVAQHRIDTLIRNGVMLALAVVCIRWPDGPFRLFRPEPIAEDEVINS
jgi:hypothetical protein